MTNPRLPTGAMTVAMVAARWGTSDTFVYDQINCGNLRAFKLGNKLWRVKLEHVEEYEERGATTPAISGTPQEPARAAPDARTIGRLLRARSA
jgi:excisionase family DNA binding protein